MGDERSNRASSSSALDCPVETPTIQATKATTIASATPIESALTGTRSMDSPNHAGAHVRSCIVVSRGGIGASRRWGVDGAGPASGAATGAGKASATGTGVAARAGASVVRSAAAVVEPGAGLGLSSTRITGLIGAAASPLSFDDAPDLPWTRSNSGVVRRPAEPMWFRVYPAVWVESRDIQWGPWQSRTRMFW